MSQDTFSCPPQKELNSLGEKEEVKLLTMVAVVEDKKDQDATENAGTLGFEYGVGPQSSGTSTVTNSPVEPQVDASLPCQPAQNNDGEAGENEPDDEVDSSSAKEDMEVDVINASADELW